MAARNVVRFGAYAHDNHIEAIDKFCQEHGLARASALEVLVLGLQNSSAFADLSAGQITTIIKAGKDMIAKPLTPTQERARLIKTLKALPTEDLAKLVETTPAKE